jgi:hypothetical protein
MIIIRTISIPMFTCCSYFFVDSGKDVRERYKSNSWQRYFTFKKLVLGLTSRFSILHLISRANVKNASSTLMEALADVSMNLIPYSIASSSPRSFET